jgi:hypothetical protein
MKKILIICFASFYFSASGGEKAALVIDSSFNLVERVEAVWSQPNGDDGRIKIFAIRVGSEAANPITIFVFAAVGTGESARSSFWSTGIRCHDVVDVYFKHSNATIIVTEDVFRDDAKPLPSRRGTYQISGLEVARLCAESPTAPTVNSIAKPK